MGRRLIFLLSFFFLSFFSFFSSSPLRASRSRVQFLKSPSYAEGRKSGVQKKYEYGCDIATAIRTGKKFDLNALEPVRKESTETDDAKRLHQQGGLDILYQEKLRVHLEQEKY